jgi:hypothetical protein
VILGVRTEDSTDIDLVRLTLLDGLLEFIAVCKGEERKILLEL